MMNSKREQNLIENESAFRELNERIQKGFDEVEQIAEAEGQSHNITEYTGKLHYICECSDEDCRRRVVITPQRFKEIHEERDRFVIICGHEVPEVEHVVEKHSQYCVVEKYTKPPEAMNKLRETDISNS